MSAPKGNKFALGNRGGKGPPPKYHSKYAKIAALAYKSGHIDQEVAELLGISVVTLHKWNLKHHEFGEARKTGKAPANERVIVSLNHRALGFSRNGKYFPPDVTACIWWLKNRLPTEWRDRREEHHTVVQDNRTAAEILAALKRDMAEMGMDLVVRDDCSFALPRVIPAMGVTPAGSESEEPE